MTNVLVKGEVKTLAYKKSKEKIDAIVEEYGNSVLRMCCLYLKDDQLAFHENYKKNR